MEKRDTIKETASLPNKYLYPEFAGWDGERYLKKLLRQILPMALYRTWEIFADHQAIGNECYLGITHLAEIAGRTTRTMEKNLASLCAKQLMVERAERKVFRSRAGVVTNRVVIIKDFTGLYVLAHEYHEWLNADEYIAADREMLSLMERSAILVAKLRRFDNYRKVLYTRLPGPLSQVREKDRWFTEYQTDCSLPETEQGQGKAAKHSQRGTLPAKESAKYLANNGAKDPMKRITESNKWKGQQRASFDSALSASVNQTVKNEGNTNISDEYHQRTSPPILDEIDLESQENAPESLVQAAISHEARTHFTSHLGEQKREGRPEKVEETDQAGVKREDEQATLSGQKKAAEMVSSPLLASSFVQEIATPFGDRNPTGTQTRLLSILNHAHLAHPADVIVCLVRAYLVARDTRTIRPEHCDPQTGQTNRMPLFCAMFQRFVEACAQRKPGDADWQLLKKELAKDPCLALWWKEQQHLVNKTLAAMFFNEPGGKQHLSDTRSPANGVQIQRPREKVLAYPTHERPVCQHKPASLCVAGRKETVRTPGAQVRPKPDQYESYVNALMATYSAPTIIQEAP